MLKNVPLQQKVLSSEFLVPSQQKHWKWFKIHYLLMESSGNDQNISKMESF